MEDREPYITGGNVRDKFLTEQLGECWHSKSTPFGTCPECGANGGIDPTTRLRTDFSTWDAFGKIWAFLIAKGLQEDFIETTWQDLKGGEFQPDWVDNQIGIRPDLIDPVKCADAAYKYLKNRG